MYVVAGCPGSGKSIAFPIQESGLDFFNIDNRAAELNGGSYVGIIKIGAEATSANGSGDCPELDRGPKS